MSRKSQIDALFNPAPRPKPAELDVAPVPALGAPNTGSVTPPAAKPPEPVGVRTGAVAAIGSMLQQWNDAARNVADMQAQMAGAQMLVALDPALIDPAPLRDRLPLSDDASFLALKQSLAESGQQVPILVRPHPITPGRYQAAYGHRRMAACAALGLQVKAAVADLTDEALIVAQGRENTERRDLSFIEIALFAHRLEQAGHPRSLLTASLGIDKADLSRFIAVAKAMPEAIIRAIGPAPKAGRARWMLLAEAIKGRAGQARAVQVTETPDFARADSDRRFALVLAALQTRDSPAAPANRTLVKTEQGATMATLQRSASGLRIVFDPQQAGAFAEFVAQEIPGLYERFRQGR